MTLRADTAELDDMGIAPGYTVSTWKALDLSGDDVVHWFRAIKIFETRIRRRFLDPVDVLIAHEIGQERGTFGFAILAIDCLLVESLQRFREGRTADGESGHLIRTFHEQLGVISTTQRADKQSGCLLQALSLRTSPQRPDRRRFPCAAVRRVDRVQRR
jgi:hypothetical protein